MDVRKEEKYAREKRVLWSSCEMRRMEVVVRLPPREIEAEGRRALLLARIEVLRHHLAT
jgi:hypothetical protein